MQSTINDAIRTFNMDTLVMLLPKLRKRCEQTIPQIVADVELRGGSGSVTITDTPNGPLVHYRCGSPVLGVAHMDYVGVKHKWQYRHRMKEVWTPRLDDRLGVFILLDLLPRLGVKLDLLLTDSEEVGASTASEFTNPLKIDYNWLVEFDRRGKDVVLYDYHDSYEWYKSLNDHGFTIGQGTFSDISNLTGMGICGMNVGVGYHNEHSTNCFCDMNELMHNIRLFLTYFQASQGTKFNFTPKPRPTYSSYMGGDYGYGGYGSYYRRGDSKWDGAFYPKRKTKDERRYEALGYGEGTAQQMFGIKPPQAAEFLGKGAEEVRTIWKNYIAAIEEARKAWKEEQMSGTCGACGGACLRWDEFCETCRDEAEMLINEGHGAWRCKGCAGDTARGYHYCIACESALRKQKADALNKKIEDRLAEGAKEQKQLLLLTDETLPEHGMTKVLNPDGSATYKFNLQGGTSATQPNDTEYVLDPWDTEGKPF